MFLCELLNSKDKKKKVKLFSAKAHIFDTWEIYKGNIWPVL